MPSDHGGSLTGDDLAALDARAVDIQSYVNSGGGSLSPSKDGLRTPASVGPQPKNFGCLPFVVPAASMGHAENGLAVRPFGSSLGLRGADVNGNFSQAIFTLIGPFQIVDQDASGQVVSILPRPASRQSGAA